MIRLTSWSNLIFAFGGILPFIGIQWHIIDHLPSHVHQLFEVCLLLALLFLNLFLTDVLILLPSIF